MNNSLTYQNNILLNKILNFYNEENNSTQLVNILKGKENISLRLIDWFITNYCKKNDVILTDNSKHLNIFQDYKLMLKSFKKKKFDPFCRCERILISLNNHNLETTVGQLNFFKWIIKNNIFQYIKDNKLNIENDMNNSKKQKVKLNINAEKKENRENIELILSFN